jgi:hypothetical protein
MPGKRERELRELENLNSGSPILRWRHNSNGEARQRIVNYNQIRHNAGIIGIPARNVANLPTSKWWEILHYPALCRRCNINQLECEHVGKK